MNTAALAAHDTRQKQIGRILGPSVAMVAFFLTANCLPDSARFVAATGFLMAVFWITEAIPLSVTALLPLVLFPIFDVADIQEAAAPFARPVIFLILGGFLIAAAVERCGLHRRVALAVVRSVGGTPRKLLAGCMAATAFLSMWISNTAATVMMLPIAMSLVRMLNRQDNDSINSERNERLEICFLLGIAYSANIGGLGTIVGTPPNALLVGFLQEQGIAIGFGRWMLFAVPLVILFLLSCWILLWRFVLGDKSVGLSISSEKLNEQNRELGPITRAEWTVITVFVATVALWICREPLSQSSWLMSMCPWITRLDDASIAMAASVALFYLPGDKETGARILDWEIASKLPWGVLVLIGGGMSLASGMEVSGLTRVIGDKLQMILALHPLLLVWTLTAVVILLTEIVSNTAIAATILPALFGLGTQTLGGPLPLLVTATLAASCAFMLPIATPPNAVLFGSGRVPMQMMVYYGAWLNLIGMFLIPGLMYLLGWVLIS